MATPTTADTRNLQWKSNNVGSKLLAKMGWTEGEGIGKRRSDEKDKVSTEGLRAVRRAESLGLGASKVQAVASTEAVSTYQDLLKSLKEEHGSVDVPRKTKKRKKSSFVFATNKSTHAKVRQAKFQSKSEDDMKCIFGGAVDFPVVSVDGNGKKRKKEKRKEKREKKLRKRESSGSSTS